MAKGHAWNSGQNGQSDTRRGASDARRVGDPVSLENAATHGVALPA
jgi:hypothetical protein